MYLYFITLSIVLLLHISIPGDMVFRACGRRFPFQCPGTSKFAPPSKRALTAAVLELLTA